MARRCDVCSKKVVYGHRTVHKHSKGWRYRAPKTNREWVPNLRDVKVYVEEHDLEVEIKMCMSCYRRYRKDGIAYINKKNDRLLKRLIRRVLRKTAS